MADHFNKGKKEGTRGGVPRAEALGIHGNPTPKSPGRPRLYTLPKEMIRLADRLFSELDAQESFDNRKSIYTDLIKIVALGIRAEKAAQKPDPTAGKNTLLGAALGGAAIQQAMAARQLLSQPSRPKKANGHAPIDVDATVRSDEGEFY